MLSLLLPVALAGDCVVDRLASTVRFDADGATRTDHWTLGAEPGATGCRLLTLPAPDGMDVVGLHGRVRRPDRRTVRFDAERLTVPSGPAWDAPSPQVRLPDADIGSTVELVVEWRGPSAPVGWSPGALGPVALAALEVQGGQARTASGPLSGGPSWSWADVPADQPPLVLVPAGQQAGPVPLAPPAPAPVWRIGLATPDVAVAVPPVGLPVRLPAPGGVVADRALRQAQVAVFEVAAPEVASPGVGADGAPGEGEGVADPEDAVMAPAPPGPACVLGAAGWTCTVGVEGARWAVPEGVPARPVRQASREQITLRFVSDAHQDGGPDEPPTGRLELRGRWTGEAAPGPVAAVAPAGAEQLACTTDGTPGAVRGRTCRFPDGPGARTWAWSSPTLPVAGALPLVAAPSGAGHLLLEAEGATVALRLDGASGPVETTRAVSLPDGPGVLAVAEGEAAWRLERVGDRAVLPDRETVIQRIALLGIQASLPEPGLPLRFKNRLDPDGMLEEVLSLVRRRVRAAPAVGRGALSPRPLVSVLRAGWGTAWEQALLLTRYLRQLKVDAVPLPVRPRSAGVGDPASPSGHTAAVVRVERAGRTHWLVPACTLCAVDELPADLHEAAVLSDAVRALPPATRGGVHITALADGGSRVALEGAAARGLRAALLDIRPAERLAAVPGLIGAPGAGLRNHTGLAEPGAAVVLELDGPTAGPPLPEVALQGSAEVVLPWAGTWRWTPPPPAADPTPYVDGLVSWAVEDGTATLRIVTPVAPRERAALGFEVARRRLGR